jgi:hypothetical protein
VGEPIVYDGVGRPVGKEATTVTNKKETQQEAAATENALTLPFNPIDTAMRTPEHARRTVQGILESYNSPFDAIAEAVQNSMDALEDAFFHNLPGPYSLEVKIDLKANTMTVLDTGVGMSQSQICEAFAPSATFKELPVVLAKRGDRYPYRGYKGVGLTFLAYGNDDIQIQSRQNGTLVKGRMRFGRKWVYSPQGNNPPLLEIDADSTPLAERGTSVTVQFSADTKPVSLSQLGASLDIWEVIVRTHTAAGQILIGQPPAMPVKIRLVLVDKDGATSRRSIDPVFYYPHLVKCVPTAFRFLNVGEYHREHPDTVDHKPEFKGQDAIFIEWDTAEIASHMEKTEAVDFESELGKYKPRLYAFRPYDQPMWSLLNESATSQHRTHYFEPGLFIGVNHQRMAEKLQVKASRWELRATNIFVLVHFDDAKPDQGRKTLQSRVMDLAHSAADDAIQYLLKQTGLLKQAGQKTTAAQRLVEKNHEDWMDNVKAHAKEEPINIPPVSYVSTPETEQDVIGLFHQLSALGLFPGLQILATSGQHTYDSYVKFEITKPLDRLRYRGIDDNPLGLSTDVLGLEDEEFSTKGLTLEFKNNLEGLIADIDDRERRKSFSHIDICVCWGCIEDPQQGYKLEEVTPVNLNERIFPGVTHVLRKDDEESHVIQVIMLEAIVKKIVAGQIRLMAGG